MSLPGDALPARDPDALLSTAPNRAAAHFVVGMLGATLGTVLMAVDAGTEGHGHGGGGTPFVMLPHQLLLTMPLVILLVLLLREVDGRRMGTAVGMALAGILLVDLLLWL
jgi:hypothetical protein